METFARSADTVVILYAPLQFFFFFKKAVIKIASKSLLEWFWSWNPIWNEAIASINKIVT